MNSKNLLGKWRDHAVVYSILHASSSSYYQQKSASLRLPSICLTAISAGISFSTQSFPTDQAVYVGSVCGFLNLIAGIFSSVASFYKVDTMSEGHRIASVNFNILSRKIKEKLTLCDDISDDFVSRVRVEFDTLIESGPEIPKCVIKAFKESEHGRVLDMPDLIEVAGVDFEHEHHPHFGGGFKRALPAIKLDVLEKKSDGDELQGPEKKV